MGDTRQYFISLLPLLYEIHVTRRR